MKDCPACHGQPERRSSLETFGLFNTYRVWFQCDCGFKATHIESTGTCMTAEVRLGTTERASRRWDDAVDRAVSKRRKENHDA